jgi:hypothetical protein
LSSSRKKEEIDLKISKKAFAGNVRSSFDDEILMDVLAEELGFEKKICISEEEKASGWKREDGSSIEFYPYSGGIWIQMKNSLRKRKDSKPASWDEMENDIISYLG